MADPKNKDTKQKKVIRTRSTMLNRLQSNLSGSSLTAWGRMASFFGDDTAQSDNNGPSASNKNDKSGSTPLWHNLLVFSAGVSVGLIIASSKMSLGR